MGKKHRRPDDWSEADDGWAESTGKRRSPVPSEDRDEFDEWRRERSDRGRKRRRHRDNDRHRRDSDDFDE
jgi:hypothetical protein